MPVSVDSILLGSLLLYYIWSLTAPNVRYHTHARARAGRLAWTHACTHAWMQIHTHTHTHTHTHRALLEAGWRQLEVWGVKNIPQYTYASWFTSGSNLSAYERALQGNHSSAGCRAGAVQRDVCWTAQTAGDVGSLPWPGERALLHLPQQGMGYLAISAPFTTARCGVLSNLGQGVGYLAISALSHSQSQLACLKCWNLCWCLECWSVGKSMLAEFSTGVCAGISSISQ